MWIRLFILPVPANSDDIAARDVVEVLLSGIWSADEAGAGNGAGGV